MACLLDGAKARLTSVPEYFNYVVIAAAAISGIALAICLGKKLWRLAVTVSVLCLAASAALVFWMPEKFERPDTKLPALEKLDDIMGDK